MYSSSWHGHKYTSQTLSIARNDVQPVNKYINMKSSARYQQNKDLSAAFCNILKFQTNAHQEYQVDLSIESISLHIHKQMCTQNEAVKCKILDPPKCSNRIDEIRTEA